MMNRSHCSTKRIFHMPFKFTFEVLLENRMWTPILKTNIVRKWADQAVLCLVKRV